MFCVMLEEGGSSAQVEALARMLGVPVPTEDLSWLSDVWRTQAEHLERLARGVSSDTDPAVIFDASWDD